MLAQRILAASAAVGLSACVITYGSGVVTQNRTAVGFAATGAGTLATAGLLFYVLQLDGENMDGTPEPGVGVGTAAVSAVATVLVADLLMMALFRYADGTK